ncbi:MAG: NADH-quinone oxidoreductase subunit I [Gammaproteobacteria bacterium]
MEANDMVIVKRKTLSLSERLYLPEILRGLRITFRKMFEPRFTRQYPEEPLITTEVTRGQPRLVVNADNNIACVSCGLCEAACPAYAITIDGQETDRTIEREPERFDIDMLRCILCGFCEEACPKEAIYMSDELELAAYSRRDLIYNIEKLKRPASALKNRMDYVRRINERWQTSSST